MKSPSSALVWETWRRNRWGFALLALLFAACAVWGAAVHRLQQRAKDLEASLMIKGALLPAQVLPLSPTGRVERVMRFKLNSKVVYEGPFSCRDSLSWWCDGFTLQLMLNRTNLFAGAGMPQGDRLSWSVLDGESKGNAVFIPYRDGEGAWAAKYVAEDWRQSGLVCSAALMGFSVLALFAIFGGTEPLEGRGFTGIPPRRFTLPMRTITLVAWPSLLGSAGILVLVVAWSRLVFPSLLPQGTPMPERHLAMLLLAGLTVFQAIVWGLPSFTKTRVALLTLLISGLLGLTMVPFINPPESLVELESVFVVGFVVAWFIGIAAAYFGVRQERQGAWAGWQRRLALADFIRKLLPRPLGFASALHAQCWFEWKRNCRLPLILYTFLIGLVLGGTLLESEPRWMFQTGLNLSLFSLFGFAVIAGLNLARDGSSKKLLLSSFAATRPLPTGTLVTAKLIAGLTTWFLAIFIWGVGALAGSVASGAFTTGSFPGPVASESALFGLIVLAASLHLFIGILPLSLSGRIPGIPWSLLPLLLIAGGVFIAFTWLAQHQWPQDLLCSILSALVVLKLVVAFWGFRRAIAFRLSSRAFVGSCVTLWLVATCICMVLVLTFNPTRENGLATASILAAVLAIPLARIAISPLVLALNRHR